MCNRSKSLIQLELERSKILTHRGNLQFNNLYARLGDIFRELRNKEIDMIEQETINKIDSLRRKLQNKHDDRVKRHTSAPFKDDIYRNAFINRTVDLEEIVNGLTAVMLKMTEYNDI